MKRGDSRAYDELRHVKIHRNYLQLVEGSVLIEMGLTKVICTATIEDTVPPFMRGEGKGWITAEYAMLPRSSQQRIPRESHRGKVKGRTHEIQRLIGRTLRAIVDFEKLGERTILIDCDVIQADGGTRTASITGSYIALADAVTHLIEKGKLPESPLTDSVAAVSVGIIEGVPILDLNYIEDSNAHVDMNVVMTGSGKFVEVQGTAEEAVFSKKELDDMLTLAEKGISELTHFQKKAIEVTV